MKFTIIGFYNYDNTIFDGIDLNGSDREIFVNNFLVNYGELESYFTDPTILKLDITNWCKKNSYLIDRLNKIAQLNYNIIENYNRTENTTETGSNQKTDLTNYHENGDYNDNNYQNAYNSATPALNDKQDGKNSSTSQSETTTGGSDHKTITSNISGNIGVTTSQQMIEQELNLTERFKLYDILAISLAKEICVFNY